MENVTVYSTTLSDYSEDITVEPVPGINGFTCFLIFFAFGAIAAFTAKTIAAPVERIKLIQQCLFRSDEENKIDDAKELVEKNSETLQFGFINCAKYIYRHEDISFKHTFESFRSILAVNDCRYFS